MLEVESFKNGHGYDYFNIKTNEGIFEISFQNNLDLYWRYIHESCILNCPMSHEFIITKENYFVYELFDDLYNKVKSGNPFSDFYVDDSFNLNRLFQNNIIDWHSDDFSYEFASRLLIIKEDEIYKVIFYKSVKEYDDGLFMTYSVRFRNSGSRYEPFNIAFMDMYNKLKDYDSRYHQMHIEEYLYKQKVKIKK